MTPGRGLAPGVLAIVMPAGTGVVATPSLIGRIVEVVRPTTPRVVYRSVEGRRIVSTFAGASWIVRDPKGGTLPWGPNMALGIQHSMVERPVAARCLRPINDPDAEPEQGDVTNPYEVTA